MRVAALVPDLMLASRVKELLEAAGHEVLLNRTDGADLAVVDVMEVDPESVSLRPALGIYAHTQPEARDRALAAGFALAVPRSRFVREAAALVDQIAPA